jgi:hypothetical protein
MAQAGSINMGVGCGWHLMALEIRRVAMSFDMGLVYCARAVRSQSPHLLAMVIEYPQVPSSKYHSEIRGGWLRKTGCGSHMQEP